MKWPKTQKTVVSGPYNCSFEYFKFKHQTSIIANLAEKNGIVQTAPYLNLCGLFLVLPKKLLGDISHILKKDIVVEISNEY